MADHAHAHASNLPTTAATEINAADVDSAEKMASDIISIVREFVEVLRTEFRPQKKQGQEPQRLEDIALYTRMKRRGVSEKVRSIQSLTDPSENLRETKNEESDADASSSLDCQRQRVLSEVALPLATALAENYQILDSIPERPPTPTANPSNQGPRSRRTKNRPPPPRGMLSIQDYTDVACLLEFIVCTGILPFHETTEASPGNSNSSKNNTSSKSLLEDRLRTKLPKSLAGRIPKDALRWGTSSASSSSLVGGENLRENLSLLVWTTEIITKVVVLDRFRPMLLPRHLVDIYGACFKIEYLATTTMTKNAKCQEIDLVGANYYRALGLSLPPSLLQSESPGTARMTVVVDPTLRAMAYQTLLSSSSSSSQPQGGKGGKTTQQQPQGIHRYRQWLQKRVSALLTDLATRDLRGLSAILTVFVPVVSSSTDQASLMSGASQRLGRTLAAMTSTANDTNGKSVLQDRLCQQLLELLTVVSPMGSKDASTANAGIHPRSMAVIQTAWAFFEHLSHATIERCILGQWASRLVSDRSATQGGIHESIRQIGALCAFVPPHSTSATKFLHAAALATTDSCGDSTLLGQLLRVAMLQTAEGISSSSSSSASRDAEQTLLLLAQAIFSGSSRASSASNEQEEIAGDKSMASWISALGPTQWDLEGHSYNVAPNLSSTNQSPVETIKVETHRSLLTPNPMEEFAASVQLTTARAEFFVGKVLLVLAPPSVSSEEVNSSPLLGLPSRIFRFLLRCYLSGENDGQEDGNLRLVATVLLPILCEKCSQEQLLFGDHRDDASGLLLLIRQVLSELADATPPKKDDDGHRHEFLKSIAGILTSLLIALMEVGSKSRSKKEEDVLQSFLPILKSLSVSTNDTYPPESHDDRKDGAAMADMAAYAMALIASRRSDATDDNTRSAGSATHLSPKERLQCILEEAEKDLGSTQAPIRAKGMVSLGRLARGFTGALAQEQKAPSLIQELDESGKELDVVSKTMDDWIEKVLQLSMVALSDKESYVYLAAIQTIVAVGDLHPKRVLPKIASAIARGDFGAEPIALSQEQVIKLAEALMFIIRRRAVTDEYVPILVNVMLRGGSPRMPPTETTAKDNASKEKDHLRIQRETANYFATGSIQSEEKQEENQDDDNPLTQQELWEEQDIRLKTGGPIFDFEEAEIVRSLRISVLSELVASTASQALVPHVGLLTRLTIEALHLEQESRVIQRSAALLARELYAKALTEATDLTHALGGIDDSSARAFVPISTALVEADEEALFATLRAFGSSSTNRANMATDSAVVARCREALDLRHQADTAGVFVASKLVLEERHKMEELPALFRGLGTLENGGETTANAIALNPIETLR